MQKYFGNSWCRWYGFGFGSWFEANIECTAPIGDCRVHVSITDRVSLSSASNTRVDKVDMYMT